MFKILGILLCLAAMVGFGLCGLIGVGSGIADFSKPAKDVDPYSTLILIFSLFGIAMSIGFMYVIRVLYKSLSDNTPPKE